MTERKQEKIQHIQEEILQVENKINKLLAHRRLLEQQAKRLAQEPEGPRPLSLEERKQQSIRDKQAYESALQKVPSEKVQKLNLFSDGQN